ncbi:WD repeat domain 60 [Pelomyxa schiedti]|nr:WD repeat domain 60 [Pelomyxa schiedti]
MNGVTSVFPSRILDRQHPHIAALHTYLSPANNAKCNCVIRLETTSQNFSIKFRLSEAKKGGSSTSEGDGKGIEPFIPIEFISFCLPLLNLAPFKHATVLRLTSEQAAKLIPDDSLSFVYIDARHDYSSVLQDLSLWYPKLKRGGVLAGHDFIDIDEMPEWRVQPDGSVETLRAVKSAVLNFTTAQTQAQATVGQGRGAPLTRHPTPISNIPAQQQQQHPQNSDYGASSTHRGGGGGEGDADGDADDDDDDDDEGMNIVPEGSNDGDDFDEVSDDGRGLAIMGNPVQLDPTTVVVEEKLKDPAQVVDINAITQAMERENSRADIQSATLDPPAYSSNVVKPQPGRASVARRCLQRANDLSELIQLEVVDIPLFELPELTEYESFFRATNRANAAVQVPVMAEISTNTDPIEFQTKACQWPERNSAALVSFADLAAATDNGIRSDLLVEEGIKTLLRDISYSMDSSRLTRFLKTAGGVMEKLLNENVARSFSKKFKKSTDSGGPKWSAGSFHFIPPPFLRSHKACCIAVSDPTIVVGFEPSTELSSGFFPNNSLCVVWNIYSHTSARSLQHTPPQCILLCEGSLTCCVISGSVVVGGTDAGSLCLWDLTESINFHQEVTPTPGKESVMLRHATFSTDGIFLSQTAVIGMGSPLGHCSRVISISIISEESPLGFATRSDNLKLASMDVTGAIVIWNVLKLSQADLAGSEINPGLRPGGSLILFRTEAIPISPKEGDDPSQNAEGDEPDLTPPENAITFAFHPTDPNQLFIAVGTSILHKGRFSSDTYPQKYYRVPTAPYTLGSNSNNLARIPECQARATTLKFSASVPSHFLSGWSDGAVCVFDTSCPTPLSTWFIIGGSGSGGTCAVKQLVWPAARPCLFFALDSGDVLHVFDLVLDGIAGVVAVDTLKNRTLDGAGGIVGLQVAQLGTGSASHIGNTSNPASSPSSSSSSTQSPQQQQQQSSNSVVMCAATEAGLVDVHMVLDRVWQPDPNELSIFLDTTTSP